MSLLWSTIKKTGVDLYVCRTWEGVVNLKNKTVFHLGIAQNCNLGQASYSKTVGESREQGPFYIEERVDLGWNSLERYQED